MLFPATSSKPLIPSWLLILLLTACNSTPISVSDASRTALVTQTPDGMTWKTATSNAVGISIDYPEKVWVNNAKTEKDVYSEEIHLVDISNDKFSDGTVGSLMPFNSTILILGIQNSGSEYVIYSDKVANESNILPTIQKRFGSTCRVQISPNPNDLNTDFVRVQWGTGEDIFSTTKCRFPNIATRLLFNQKSQLLVSLFMNQEERFLSKEIAQEPNVKAYDNLISHSLRFIND